MPKEIESDSPLAKIMAAEIETVHRGKLSPIGRHRDEWLMEYKHLKRIPAAI
jgi:hypothetical protein